MGTSPLRRELHKRQNGLCHYCRIPMRMTSDYPDSVTVDHIIPRCDGGTRRPGNIVGACFVCNNARGNMPYETFKATIDVTGRPETSLPMKARSGAREKLVRRVEKEEQRLREKAIKEGKGSWTAPKSSFRPYLDDVGKHNALGDALRAAGLKESGE